MSKLSAFHSISTDKCFKVCLLCFREKGIWTKASCFLTLWLNFILFSNLQAAEPGMSVVKIGAEKLPPSVRYAAGAMAKLEIRSSNPMQVRWEPGYPKVATAWHLGGGVWMTLGSEIARHSVAGSVPFPQTTTGKFYAGFGVGPTSAPIQYREETFEMYLVGMVRRLVQVPQDFQWKVVEREAEIWMAEFDPRRTTGDYAIFRVRDLQPSAKISLSVGEEELGAGDEVIVMGYPGNDSFGMPIRSNDLYAVRGRIEKISNNASIILDRSLDSGFEGGLILHVNSGRAIGMVTSSVRQAFGRSSGISGFRVSSVAIDLRALRLDEKLQSILNGDCASVVAKP